jgi:hypothetical protein
MYEYNTYTQTDGRDLISTSLRAAQSRNAHTKFYKDCSRPAKIDLERSRGDTHKDIES